MDLQPSELRNRQQGLRLYLRRQTVVGGTPAQLLQVIQDNAGELSQYMSVL